MDNYIVNKNTLALISHNNGTKVYEQNKEFFVGKTPNNIIKNSCLFYGSSFEGRILGTKNILGIRYKIPIIIENSNNIIFFPTDSIRNNNCNWISLNNVNNCSNSQHQTKILFMNGQEIYLNISKYIIDNQIFKASRLQNLLNQRIVQ